MSPLDESIRQRAITGYLQGPLAPSQALRFEASAEALITLESADFELDTVSVDALAAGANRMLIGDEVLQFAAVQRQLGNTWRLTGLLRGRGGTEAAALSGHPTGALATLLGDELVPLAASDLSGASQLAAIGPADNTPAYAEIENIGLALRPLTPVHPRSETLGDGSLRLVWVRRARGSWIWSEDVDVPLVEDQELYLVGLGPVDQPHALWSVSTPGLDIASAQRSSFAASHPGARLWVRQTGTHAQSLPLDLGAID